MNTTENSTSSFVDSLVDEFRDTAGDAIAMFEGKVEVDPIFFLDCCATAGLLENAELDGDTSGLLAAMKAQARTRTGRDALSRAADLLDLGADLDFTLDEELPEQIDRLQRLIELSGLSAFLEGAHLARLEEVYDRNSGVVFSEPDKFEELYEYVIFLRDAVPVGSDHLARRFLDELAALTNPFPVEIDDKRLAEALEKARVKALKRTPWWMKLSEWLHNTRQFAKEKSESFEKFLTEATARPALVMASSHGAERVAWPAPRCVLGKRDNVEIALIADQRGIVLEWVGGDLPNRVKVKPAGETLPVVGGPLAQARYYSMPESLEVEGESTLEVEYRGETWSVPLAGEWAVSSDAAGAEGRFKRLRREAPGAAREMLAVVAGRDESAARRLEASQALERLPLMELSRDIGVAYFPVTRGAAGDFPGTLGCVKVGGLNGTHSKMGGLDAVRYFVEALGAARGSGKLQKFAFSIEGVPSGCELSGTSWELGAAAALVSHVLGVAPSVPVIASGRLSEAGIEPIGEIEEKLKIIAREAGEVDAVLVGDLQEPGSVFEKWFGAGVSARLASAMGSSPGMLARTAVSHWVMSERAAAKRFADDALNAGVEGLQRAEALWVRGGALLHEARTEEALATLMEARATYAEWASKRGQRKRLAVEETEAFLGIALIDTLKFEESLGLMRSTKERLEAIPEGERFEEWDRVWVQVVGSLARAELASGHIDEAAALLESSEKAALVSTELARTRGDLAEVERRRGNLEKAAELLVKARNSLCEIPAPEQRKITERFLRLYEVRCGAARATYPIESPNSGVWPKPAEVIESLLAGSSEGFVAWFDEEVLPGLETLQRVFAYFYLGAVARAGAKWGATPELVKLFETLEGALASKGGELLPASVSRTADGSPNWAGVMARVAY
jgi:hypothetical protein